MHTHIYTYVHTYIYTHEHTHIHTEELHAGITVQGATQSLYIHTFTYMYIYIYTYVHTHIYTLIHTHIHTEELQAGIAVQGATQGQVQTEHREAQKKLSADHYQVPTYMTKRAPYSPKRAMYSAKKNPVFLWIAGKT